MSESLSETNRMRQSLGLPLLSETVETPAQSAERTAVENARAQQRQQAKEREDDELKQRLIRHREERLYKKQLQGTSLAEEIVLEKDKAAASAADWVAQSRSRQQQRQKEVEAAAKRAALQKKRARGDPEAKAIASDLRVRHDAEEFAEGESVILTLKDRRIGHGDDAEEDELQNLDIVERKKLDRNLGRKTKKPKYDAYADTKQDILPQYDEPIDELDAAKGGIRLNSEGQFADDVGAASQGPSMRDTIKQRLAISLETESGINNEYYTKEEMVAFKKPKKPKKLKKEKKRSRKPSKIVFEEPDLVGPSSDHGSRAASVKAKMDAIRDESERQRKQQRFASALSKADERSHTLLDQPDAAFEDDAEDRVLQESLERARRAALRKPQRGHKAVLAAVSQVKKEQQKQPKKPKGLTFSAASEFMTNLDMSAAEMLEKRKASVRREKEKAAAQLQMVMKQEEEENRKRVKVEEEGEDMEVDSDQEQAERKHTAPEVKREADVDDEEDYDEEEDEDEDLKFMHDGNRLSSGIGAALKFIRGRGLLQKREEVLAGRASDQSVVKLEKDQHPHLKLERVDRFGRQMTKKQAFRELSYTFHGQSPGPKKLEKLERDIERQTRKQIVSSGGVSAADRLREATERTGRHYLVLGSQRGAYGDVSHQKMAIGDEDQSAGPSGAVEPNAAGVYVSGGKKVEFGFSKAKSS